MTGILKRSLAGVMISVACGAGLALAAMPGAVAATPKPGWSISYHLPSPARAGRFHR